MNIAIIGTGGVGGYFGGKLALAGHNVTFLARGNHLEAIRQNGLTVKSIHGDFTVKPAIVTSNTDDIKSPDLVILGIKAWQVKEMAARIRNIIHEKTIVLPLQNGVMAAEELKAELGGKHVIGGLCRIFSKIEAPGIITHFGVEPEIVFGELNHEITDRIKALQLELSAAGFRATITSDIHTELWKKLMIIGSGALLALTRSPYGSVRENQETRELMCQLLTEICQVANKSGASIDVNFVDKTMQYIDTYPYEATTSLARDIWAGNPSELEYQNGTVVSLGEKYGVPVNVNKFIYQCLLPMERRARAR